MYDEKINNIKAIINLAVDSLKSPLGEKYYILKGRSEMGLTTMLKNLRTVIIIIATSMPVLSRNELMCNQCTSSCENEVLLGLNEGYKCTKRANGKKK